MRRLMFLIPLVLFLGLAGWFAVRLKQIDRGDTPDRLPSVMIDKPVPAFDLPPLVEGQPGVASTGLADGKVRLVNFWASWCAPCRAEHPILMRLAGQGVDIRGIDYKDKAADGQAILARDGNPYAAVAMDQSGRTAIDFGVYGVPETYVIDRQGRIRYRQVGPITPQDLQTRILPLINELSK
ncbi:DsbE family thiol:disulfide interchange protein [Nitrospirillum iridis]|uniref:Cytochrome c biogenesis protein CcmG/thiol:disulfide interchange protein DsbE n=1 Tax=Nitrospirillum iridis TaxID=765888 RepID=A0A7X0B0G7_9PROT|nr:DsbE family thiol:disulfide interchange protein [Nitrospirillum iridis]MBB6253519.1 cytochrome c biogenesis protein CcmG/thiol:disulfide interchange protein DsbE [Nitrospirillum iridis]